VITKIFVLVEHGFGEFSTSWIKLFIKDLAFIVNTVF
jgi:hypothetical protein